MSVISMKNLLESGVHFGHQTRRWNPKMKRFIFAERNGIYIIDLQKTVKKVEKAYKFIKQTVSDGKEVLFVGTKKQAKDTIRNEAIRCGMNFVNQRWLGGMLTNFKTIRKRIVRLKELEILETQNFPHYTKKEVVMLRKEAARLDKFLGGIKDMTKLPGAVFVIDPKKEHIAIAEARKLGIPTVAVVDTNCDPDPIDYVIPGNDDAIRAVKLLSSTMANAVLEGKEGNQFEEVAAVAPVAKAAAPVVAPVAKVVAPVVATPAPAAPVATPAPVAEAKPEVKTTTKEA